MTPEEEAALRQTNTLRPTTVSTQPTIGARPTTDPRVLQTGTQSYAETQAVQAGRNQERRDAAIAANSGLPGGTGAPGSAVDTLLGAPGTVTPQAAAPGVPNMSWSKDAYINIAHPSSFKLGGYDNYARETGLAAHQVANNAAAQQAGIGNTQLGIAGTQLGLANESTVTGAQYADRLQNAGASMTNYGLGQASQINEQARATASMGDTAFGQGNAVMGRAGPVADFGAQNAALGQSQGAVDQLLAVEAQQGPSAAQAQLQAGLNAAADSNTSLARSGRGWGQSASALAQAGRQNAVMAANAGNQAAILRAQEDAAARQRAASNIATGAGIQQAAASQFGAQAQANVQNALQQTQLNDAARANLYNNALQAQQVAGAQQTAAGQLGLSGLQAGTAATAQAGQLDLGALGQASGMASQASNAANLAGANYATGAQQQQQALIFNSQLAQAQLQASQAYEQARLQEYGIRKDVAIQGANNTMALIGGGLAAAGTVAAAVSDVRAKDRIVPVSAVESLLSEDDSLLRGESGEELDAREDPFYGSYGGQPYRADALEADAGALGRARQSRSSGYAGPDADQMSAHMGRADAEPEKDKGMAAAGGAMKAFGGSLGKGSRGLGYLGQRGPRDFGYRPITLTSDEREKTNLRPARAYSYEYRDPERHGEGRFVGPMAQDLLKTPAGKSSVVRQPDGTLGVDTGRLSLTNTAAIGEQQRHQDDVDERVSALERLLAADREEQRGRRTAENSHLPKGRAA